MLLQCYVISAIIFPTQTKEGYTMKRIAVIALALCLLMCGCGPQYEVPYAPTNTADVTAEPTNEPTVEPTTEPTEPPVLYRHPLTGEPLDAPYTSRPVSVVINNLKKCLPQYGIAAADMMYEVETEGGITRFLAIYTDLTQVASIGPVRSLRTFFTSVAASYDSPTIHCGGSVKGLQGMHDFNNKLKNWEHIDQRYNGKYFYRDKERRSQGYALEHTLFTTGEMLIEALAAKKYDKVYDSEVSYGLQFADEVALGGEAANTVTVTFTGKKTTTFTLDAATGLYKASQYKQDHVDGGTGEVLAYRNVLVLQSPQKRSNDGYYVRSYYTLTGEGEGYFACDGQIVPIKWVRKSVNDPFAYTLADGTPITLGVGKSYVAIIGVSGAAGVKYE